MKVSLRAFLLREKDVRGMHEYNVYTRSTHSPHRARGVEVGAGMLLFLFVLFAAYGPAFGFAGQMGRQ